MVAMLGGVIAQRPVLTLHMNRQVTMLSFWRFRGSGMGNESL